MAGTLMDVAGWVEQKGNSGELKASTARLWASALSTLQACITGEDPQDLDWILENLPHLSRRWANLNPDKRGDTSKTYESRARSAIGCYLKWRADPSGFRFELRSTKPRVGRVTPHDRAEAVKTAPVTPPASAMRQFPFADGREASFVLPEDFQVRDVMKLACHLLTLAEDFEPMDPQQSQFFAMVRHERTGATGV